VTRREAPTRQGPRRRAAAADPVCRARSRVVRVASGPGRSSCGPTRGSPTRTGCRSGWATGAPARPGNSAICRTPQGSATCGSFQLTPTGGCP